MGNGDQAEDEEVTFGIAVITMLSAPDKGQNFCGSEL